MEKVVWHTEALPEGVKPDRVHAVLVTKDGRVFLRYKNHEVRKVTGGHIDPDDTSIESALARELLEEINCKIDRQNYLGYLEYTNDEDGVHEIWARMVARISEILPAQADIDRDDGMVYGRVLAPLDFARAEEVKQDLYATTMSEVLDYAYRTAQEKGYFTEPLSQEKEILNEESLNPA